MSVQLKLRPYGVSPKVSVKECSCDATCTRGRCVRATGSFQKAKHRTGYIIAVTVLTATALILTIAILSYENPMPFGSSGYWSIAKMRGTAVVTMAIVAVCQAFATVSFQTATSNRIITPSIMGFEALYVAIQTSLIFFFGVAGFSLLGVRGQLILQSLIMIGFACLLYGWLLSGKFGNIHITLLVGVVIGGGLGALATFMQRLLTPSDFDILTAKLFGNVSNADPATFPIVIPVVVLTAAVIWRRAAKLNCLQLGSTVSTNLGLNHRREVMVSLLLVSILMAMTTSLVGPMTFLGFLVATLAYQVVDSYDHRLILPVAGLIGYVILAGAYFVMKNVFYAQGAVTIIIELVGGLTFLFFVLRKGRL